MSKLSSSALAFSASKQFQSSSELEILKNGVNIYRSTGNNTDEGKIMLTGLLLEAYAKAIPLTKMADETDLDFSHRVKDELRDNYSNYVFTSYSKPNMVTISSNVVHSVIDLYSIAKLNIKKNQFGITWSEDGSFEITIPHVADARIYSPVEAITEFEDAIASQLWYVEKMMLILEEFGIYQTPNKERNLPKRCKIKASQTFQYDIHKDVFLNVAKSFAKFFDKNKTLCWYECTTILSTEE